MGLLLVRESSRREDWSSEVVVADVGTAGRDIVGLVVIRWEVVLWVGWLINCELYICGRDDERRVS